MAARASGCVLRLLLGVRALALASIALCAAYATSFIWLVVPAALAGSVNGGLRLSPFRIELFRFTRENPTSPGIAATLNELTLVLAPVAASVLGSLSPLFCGRIKLADDNGKLIWKATYGSIRRKRGGGLD